MIDLSTIVVADSAGEPVRIGEIVDRPTMVDVVRYYGCPPCRLFLDQIAERMPQIEAAGGGALGIGPRAAYQAAGLQRRGIPFPLLLDPAHHVGRAVGLRRQSLLRFVFDLRAWGRWLRAFLRKGQGMVTGGWWEVPAVLVLDADARVVWAHRGRSIGDYPSIDESMQQLLAATESAR